MNIINHHILLHSLLNRTITTLYNEYETLCNYAEGDLYELCKDLNKKCDDTLDNNAYPYIWLKSGYTVETTNTYTTLRNCWFFFITRGSKVDGNNRRFNDTYQDILYPLLNDFINVINTERGIDIHSYKDKEMVVKHASFPFNDLNDLKNSYQGNGNDNLTTTSAIWDAISLNIDIRIDNTCNRKFIIKQKK